MCTLERRSLRHATQSWDWPTLGGRDIDLFAVLNLIPLFAMLVNTDTYNAQSSREQLYIIKTSVQRRLEPESNYFYRLFAFLPSWLARP